MILASCYREKAMYQKALDELSQEKKCQNDSTGVDYAFGIVYTKMGQIEKARHVLEVLEARESKGIGMAELYFALGDIDKGFQILENMYQNRDMWISFIKIRPGLDVVRSDLRFKDMLKRIGLD